MKKKERKEINKTFKKREKVQKKNFFFKKKLFYLFSYGKKVKKELKKKIKKETFF
jgi:hypothetical protein